MSKPLILITNDDGLEAPGIKKLISIAGKFGNVVVVAPESCRSGMSHAVTISQPLRLKQIKNTENLKIYSTNGTPVDSIKLAMHFILNKTKPDLILSGINHGANSSVNIFYSGTMAAVIEGCMLNIPSVGISYCSDNYDAPLDILEEDCEFIISNVLKNGLPYRTCLNVNFPENYDKKKGLRVCRQAHAYWEEEFEERIDTHNKPYYWLKGKFNALEFSEDTDLWALKNNYASIVPIQVDLTAHNAIAEIDKCLNL